MRVAAVRFARGVVWVGAHCCNPMLGAVASSVGRELHQCPGLVKLEAASETGPAVRISISWLAEVVNIAFLILCWCISLNVQGCMLVLDECHMVGVVVQGDMNIVLVAKSICVADPSANEDEQLSSLDIDKFISVEFTVPAALKEYTLNIAAIESGHYNFFRLDAKFGPSAGRAEMCRPFILRFLIELLGVECTIGQIGIPLACIDELNVDVLNVFSPVIDLDAVVFNSAALSCNIGVNTFFGQRCGLSSFTHLPNEYNKARDCKTRHNHTPEGFRVPPRPIPYRIVMELLGVLGLLTCCGFIGYGIHLLIMRTERNSDEET